jgi:hypothetical protein
MCEHPAWRNKNACGQARVPATPCGERFAVPRVVGLKVANGRSAGMAETIERYRQYASECLRLAQEAADDAHKARLLEMAAAWQRLVEAATKRGEK